MPRTAKSGTKLTSPTSREKLKPRPKAYFKSLAPGKLLGYIRIERNAGRWLVQHEIDRTEKGAPVRRQKQLGVADDRNSPAGSMSYAEAIKAAMAWSPDGTHKGAITVRIAIERYVANQSATKGEAAGASAESTLRFHVLREDAGGNPLDGEKGLGDVAIIDLTNTVLEAWRNALLDGKRKPATVNRTWTTFRAVLNYAWSKPENGIPSDAAWRKLKPLEGTHNPRQDHFDSEQVAALIHAAHTHPMELDGVEGGRLFAELLQVGYLTGMRYGELGALSVKHFDAEKRIVTIPARAPGLRVKTGSRHVSITPDCAKLLSRLCRGRGPHEPLLRAPTESGRWGAGMQQKRMKAALKVARLPTSATFYVLRHSYISRAIEAGMPLTLLADNVGTSVAIIEKTYAKLLSHMRQKLIDTLSPTLPAAPNFAIA